MRCIEEALGLSFTPEEREYLATILINTRIVQLTPKVVLVMRLDDGIQCNLGPDYEFLWKVWFRFTVYDTRGYIHKNDHADPPRIRKMIRCWCCDDEYTEKEIPMLEPLPDVRLCGEEDCFVTYQMMLERRKNKPNQV